LPTMTIIACTRWREPETCVSLPRSGRTTRANCRQAFSRMRRMKNSVRVSNTRLKNSAVAAVVTCGFLMMLPDWWIPGFRGTQGSQPIPENFFLPESYSGPTGLENSAPIPTVEFFQDPYLIGLIEQAFVGNQELKILAEDIQIPNNEILRRRGAYLPFLTF